MPLLREMVEALVMKAYADLADLPEDDRIHIIGKTAEAGNLTGFVVEDDEKADRYIEKLKRWHRVNILDRGPGPIRGTILVRVGPLAH
jgi:hypothetical protein